MALGGRMAFSVSESNVASVTAYIDIWRFGGDARGWPRVRVRFERIKARKTTNSKRGISAKPFHNFSTFSLKNGSREHFQT